jgi:hypothetical protein
MKSRSPADTVFFTSRPRPMLPAWDGSGGGGGGLCASSRGGGEMQLHATGGCSPASRTACTGPRYGVIASAVYCCGSTAAWGAADADTVSRAAGQRRAPKTGQ